MVDSSAPACRRKEELVSRNRLIPAACAALAAFTLACGPAGAEGVTRVQQPDGSVQTYEHVRIRLAGQTLFIHSHDQQGVLEVTSGACSFAGDVKRCLPFRTALHQHGKTHPIALQRGTIYTNLTDAVQRLPHSSRQLAPHEILVLLHTLRGTYVSVQGSLDEVH